MKAIAQRVWTEPAAFIGLVTSIALAILAVATGTHWDASVIAGVAAPFASALGIRQLVTPTGPPSAGQPAEPSQPEPPGDDR